MNENTISMCEHCYRHVPANKFEKDGKIWISKTCPEHGYHECLVEIDSKFYQEQIYNKRKPNSYWLDTTNRCNLDCPHCYQMPDNMSKDPSIDELIKEIEKWPDDGLPISLVGAEPTTRKDLVDLVDAINSLDRKPRTILIVTNGINLGKFDYAEKFKDIKNLKWTIGLNHPEYNGGTIRKKQEQGIKNCIELGLTIKNFTYTLANLEQLDFVLEEMQSWNNQGICDNARIQVGVDIGRVPEGDHREYYLSELVKAAKKVADIKGWSWEPDIEVSNRTHYAVRINGVLHRLIKWCDVRTIDFEETQSESWAQLIPHKPMTSLLHQVILRDRYINEGLPLYDTIPEKYQNTQVKYEKISRYFVRV
jgi:organic radical activating enzyme